MTNCEHGPNDTAGCDGEIIWHEGVAYSKHFAASHWGRLKAGTAKPKNEFSADISEAEQKSLEAAIAAAKEK